LLPIRQSCINVRRPTTDCISKPCGLACRLSGSRRRVRTNNKSRIAKKTGPAEHHLRHHDIDDLLNERVRCRRNQLGQLGMHLAPRRVEERADHIGCGHALRQRVVMAPAVTIGQQPFERGVVRVHIPDPVEPSSADAHLGVCAGDQVDEDVPARPCFGKGKSVVKESCEAGGRSGFVCSTTGLPLASASGRAG